MKNKSFNLNVADKLVTSNFLKVDEFSGEVSTTEVINREDFVEDETVFYLYVLAEEEGCNGDPDCQVEGTSVGILKVSVSKIWMKFLGEIYWRFIRFRMDLFSS